VKTSQKLMHGKYVPQRRKTAAAHLLDDVEHPEELGEREAKDPQGHAGGVAEGQLVLEQKNVEGHLGSDQARKARGKRQTQREREREREMPREERESERGSHELDNPGKHPTQTQVPRGRRCSRP
jgi:hypothetical protein